MASFNDYARRYETITMTRDEHGVLEMTFHSGGDSLRWSGLAHSDMANAFRKVANDAANRIVLMTGTGAEFCGPRASSAQPRFTTPPTAAIWEKEAFTECREMLGALLDIAVPVVSVVNGPAYRHSEVPLLADIVVASDDASFEDSAHFAGQSMVPGDGVHVVYTMLLGINRARNFLLTGQVLDAQEALRLGMVAEVVPKANALARGRELTRVLAAKPDMLLRYTRALLVQPIKRNMLDYLALGLGIEGMAILK